MSYSVSELTANLDAINKYMMETKLNTSEAGKLRNEWLKWWEGLTWYDKTFEPDTFDIARNRRNAFNIANAKSPSAKQAVKQSILEGVTAEEARGEVRRTTTEGSYLEDEVPIEIVPTRWKFFGTVILGLVGAGWAAKKVYIDGNPLFKLTKSK